jgi:hypothetical protein
MSRACSTNRERRNTCRILVGNPEVNGPVSKPRCMRVDNIKTDLREIG